MPYATTQEARDGHAIVVTVVASGPDAATEAVTAYLRKFPTARWRTAVVSRDVLEDGSVLVRLRRSASLGQ